MANAASTTRLPHLQELLLLAAFGPEPSARAAWSELSPQLNVDTMAFEAHALLPPLADRLRRLGLPYQELPRIDGIRKRTWYLNSRRVRSVASAWRQLAARSIPAAATGGLGVLLLQPDLGARQLEDADLLISAADASGVLAALTEAEWQSVGQRRDGFLLDQHALLFRKDGQSVTVRWVEEDALFSHPGEPTQVSFADASLPVVPAADLLAFTLTETWRMPGYAPVRRLGDALLTLSRCPSLDWDAFQARVERRKAALVVRGQVHYLAGRLGADVPGDVQSRLDQSAVHLGDRLAVRLSRRSDTAAAFLRRTSGDSLARAIGQLPTFARELWELTPDQNPMTVALHRARRRLVNQS